MTHYNDKRKDGDKMLYDSLYSDFCELFKEDRRIFEEKQKAQLIEDCDGMHILFGFIVVPYVINLINECENEKVKTAFAFFEEMADSKDAKISEVLEFTVLEGLIARGPKFLNTCKSLMGDKTLESCKHIETWFAFNPEESAEVEKILCEHCGNELEYFQANSICGYYCGTCGDCVITSYFEPIVKDSVVYTIFIDQQEPIKDAIKAASKVFGCNYLDARKGLAEGTLNVSAGAREIQKKAIILQKGNVLFHIEPEFPYSIEII